MSNYSEQIDGQGYEALVAAHNRVLADLSRDIADAVTSVDRDMSGK
jgi:hypothetical protein